jgi:hypothetical protein
MNKTIGLRSRPRPLSRLSRLPGRPGPKLVRAANAQPRHHEKTQRRLEFLLPGFRVVKTQFRVDRTSYGDEWDYVKGAYYEATSLQLGWPCILAHCPHLLWGASDAL